MTGVQTCALPILPDAILIRALEPVNGFDIMLERTGKKMFDNTLTKGPGNVAKAMGISKNITGLIVGEKIINIYKDDFSFLQDEIGTSKRIGIDGAETDAELPYRFFVRGNKFVSGRPVR